MAEGRVVSGRITPPPWPPIAISLTSVDASVVVPGPTKTDATGRFEFRDVAAGRYRFTAWLGRQFHHFGAEIHVSRDAVTHAHLSLDPARTIGGRVVDEQDRPVPWAEIAIHDRESDGGATRGIVYAGPRGGFHIRDAARGGVRLTVHTQGRHPETEVEARSGDTGVIVRLSKRFPLVGRAVVSPEGTPPPSFRVCVYPGGRSWSVQSPEGRFEIPARELPDEVFEVEARDAGGRVSRRVSGLKNRTPIAQLELALREGGSIVGRLIWSDGKPAAGIAVAVQPVAAIKRIQTRTDARGRFEADGLQAGPHRLIARPEGAREAVRRVDVAAGRRSEVKWVLPRTP
jgi:hypothetical protein